MLNYIYGIEGGRRRMGNSVYMEEYMNEYFKRSGTTPYPEKELTPHEKQEEHIKNAKEQLRLLKIEKVIFNENATIVFFEDKKKIVVKCSEMDCYSKEAAIALAYLKWDVGEEYFHYVLSALTCKKGDKVDRGRHFKPIEICDFNAYTPTYKDCYNQLADTPTYKDCYNQLADITKGILKFGNKDKEDK